jgi:hypothetical protein
MSMEERIVTGAMRAIAARIKTMPLVDVDTALAREREAGEDAAAIMGALALIFADVAALALQDVPASTRWNGGEAMIRRAGVLLNARIDTMNAKEGGGHARH